MRPFFGFWPCLLLAFVACSSSHGTTTEASPRPAATLATQGKAFPFDDLPRKFQGSTIDIQHGTFGVLLPDHKLIAAVPLVSPQTLRENNLEHRTDIGIYGIQNGRPVLLQVLNSGEAMDDPPSIRDGHLQVSNLVYRVNKPGAWWVGVRKTTYALQGGRLMQITAVVVNLTPPPYPGDWNSPAPAAPPTAIANVSKPAPNPNQGAAVGGGGCDEDSIETVADDGAKLILLTGAVYTVTGGDEATSATWLAADDVLICDGDTKIINKDENGESVEVVREP